jgi:hypothetical protein
LHAPSFPFKIRSGLLSANECDCVVLVVFLNFNAAQDWGAEGDNGVLGANVASGYLHLLPAHCCESIGK